MANGSGGVLTKVAGVSTERQVSRFAFAVVSWIVLGAGVAAGERPGGDQAESAAVRITVRDKVDLPEREVTIADIAVLEGGPAELREWIEQLDIADAPQAARRIRVTRQQIAFRIRLAGVEDRLYKVDGANEAWISAASSIITESELVAAAQQFVRARLPWEDDEILIQPAQPIRTKITVPTNRSGIRLEAQLRSQRAPIGKVRIDVAIWADGHKQQEVPVFLDVRVYQQVAVAKRRIERGQLLSEDNVQFDRRSVAETTDYLTAKDTPVGQRARRSITPAQIIASADIEPPDATKQVLVKPGDVVKIVARAGAMTLATTGEALQEGPVGKMIRVRNVDSKMVVTGRVVDRSTVEVLR